MIREIVLDTNVLISGLLSPFGPPGRIVDLLQTDLLGRVADARIHAEYRNVVARRSLRLDLELVLPLLDLMDGNTRFITPEPWPHPLPDPDDEPFIAVAHAAGVPLITGNLKHFPANARQGVSVMTPAAFLQEW